MDIDIHKAGIDVLLAQLELALAVLKDNNLTTDDRAEAHGIISNPAITESIEKKLKIMKINEDPDYIRSIATYHRLELRAIDDYREKDSKGIMYQ